MTYKLFVGQRLLAMLEQWRLKTIKTLRRLLVEVAGKLVRRSGKIILRVAASLDK
jgi:hypothetical protein